MLEDVRVFFGERPFRGARHASCHPSDCKTPPGKRHRFHRNMNAPWNASSLTTAVHYLSIELLQTPCKDALTLQIHLTWCPMTSNVMFHMRIKRMQKPTSSSGTRHVFQVGVSWDSCHPVTPGREDTVWPNDFHFKICNKGKSRCSRSICKMNCRTESTWGS